MSARREEIVEQALALGQADGSLRAEVSPAVAVRIITSGIHGVLDRRRFGTRPHLHAERDLDALALRTVPATAPV